MKASPFQAHLLDSTKTAGRLKVIYFYASTWLLYLSSLSLGQNVNFIKTDFSKDMSLSGSCLVENGTGILWMTATRNNSDSISAVFDSACKAVYSTKVRIYDPPTGLATSWNTSFTFTIQPQNGGNVGVARFLTFSITANKTVGTPLAAGLYDDTVLKPGGNPEIQVVAVCLDTFWNNVSLLINDKESASLNWNLAKFNVSLNMSFQRMTTYQAWIEYDAGSKTMEFYIAPRDERATKSDASRVFLEPLDLSNSARYATVPSESYIGFTAATGPEFRQIPKIVSWEFSHLEASNSSSMVGAGGPSSRERFWYSWKRLFLGVGIGVAFSVLVVIAFLSVRRCTRPANPKFDAVSRLNGINFGPRRFTDAELRLATDNFSEDRLLGKGGFGSVYRGSLVSSDRGEEVSVAIKRISQNSVQGEREFDAEVLSIGRLSHRNLVPLLGWCQEQKELLLVYKFMANGSLDQHLYPKNGKPTLSWESRFQILQSMAKALDYIHNEWEECILHRDIKPSNILLDSEMNARLGDFGLARLTDHGHGNTTTEMIDITRVVGTIGYIEPVSYCYQKFTPKSDVYSFGVMALEVVCGRLPQKPVEEDSEESLVKWVWSQYEKKQLFRVIDSSLGMKLESDEVLPEEVTRVLHLGMLCTMRHRSLRPKTAKLLQALTGAWRVSLPAWDTLSLQDPLPLSGGSIYSSSTSVPLMSEVIDGRLESRRGF